MRSRAFIRFATSSRATARLHRLRDRSAFVIARRRRRRRRREMSFANRKWRRRRRRRRRRHRESSIERRTLIVVADVRHCRFTLGRVDKRRGRGLRTRHRRRRPRARSRSRHRQAEARRRRRRHCHQSTAATFVARRSPTAGTVAVGIRCHRRRVFVARGGRRR